MSSTDDVSTTDDVVAGTPARPTVFLSYASQDRDCARRLRDALAGAQLDVWYDENELGGGEAWDQKIRQQIRRCDYFMPVISTQTEARLEGYFRREWRLAVERTLDMADDRLFLLPVVIDATDQSRARVPERFQSVQWIRVPDGRATPAFEALCLRLNGGGAVADTTRGSRPGMAPAAAIVTPSANALPAFPAATSGSVTQRALALTGWSLRAGWSQFQRAPRWLRVIVYCWLFVWSLTWLDRSGDSGHDPGDLSPAKAAKLKAIADHYQGAGKADIAKLGVDIARELAKGDDADAAKDAPLLAIPFVAPADDADARKFADATFAMVYGRLAISHPGRVGLTDQPLAAADLGAAIERGRSLHAAEIVFGRIEGQGPERRLAIQVADAAKGSALWSASYPVAGVDPAKIAAEVDSKVTLPDPP